MMRFKVLNLRTFTDCLHLAWTPREELTSEGF